MFGVYDVLVRVWLPNGCQAVEFQEALLKELKPHGLEVCEPFAVEYPIRHWAFSADDAPDEPHALRVKKLLRDPDLIRRVEAEELSASEVKTLQGEGLVAVPDYPDPNHPGIKFAIVVGGESRTLHRGATGTHNLTAEDRESLEELAIDVVDGARLIRERSLYSGSGFSHFVILGRVGYEHFHEIHASLVTQFGVAPIRERFELSTITMVSGQRGLRLFSEALLDSPFVVRTPAKNVAVGFQPPQQFESGDTVADRFEVVKSLGEGGFGTVYRVLDHREGGVERALKLFQPGGSDAAQRELSMLRKVSDRHVVKMFWGDRDRETGCWYLVSEFVEGTSLEPFVRGKRRGELSDRESVEIVRQVLLGLEAVHPQEGRLAELAEASETRELSGQEWDEWQSLKDKAIVHRDIKPENIMISLAGTVKLIDFNIASPAGALIKTNSRTERYAPPQGWPERTWKPQVDLFATGIVLYELLCGGEDPYPDRIPPMVDPIVHRPDLTKPQLDFLVRSCSVEVGYVTARSMREDLERAWRAPSEESPQ